MYVWVIHHTAHIQIHRGAYTHSKGGRIELLKYSMMRLGDWCMMQVTRVTWLDQTMLVAKQVCALLEEVQYFWPLNTFDLNTLSVSESTGGSEPHQQWQQWTTEKGFHQRRNVHAWNVQLCKPFYHSIDASPTSDLTRWQKPPPHLLRDKKYQLDWVVTLQTVKLTRSALQ